MANKVFTGNVGREMMGVGSVLNVYKGTHSGTTKRPAEGGKKMDDWNPVVTKSPEDFKREREERRLAEDLKEREARNRKAGISGESKE